MHISILPCCHGLSQYTVQIHPHALFYLKEENKQSPLFLKICPVIIQRCRKIPNKLIWGNIQINRYKSCQGETKRLNLQRIWQRPTIHIFFILNSVFKLYPLPKIRQIFTKEEKRSETLMCVVYPLPGTGLRYSIMAWEWTVYSFVGVWRCLR